MEEKREVQMPDMLLPDDFSSADMAAHDYGAPLSEAAKEIECQNLLLIEQAKKAGFRPDIALEYAENGGQRNINEFFETLARYAEGRIPACALGEMVPTTEALLDVLEKLAGAPMLEIDAARIAFRKTALLWTVVLPRPRQPRKTYLSTLFAHRAAIGQALEALHRAYVKARLDAKAPHKGKRRGGARRRDRMRADDCARVFQAITQVREKYGKSTREAIEHLRRIPTWKTRLGTVKDETWRNYYTKRNRRLEDAPEEEVDARRVCVTVTRPTFDDQGRKVGQKPITKGTEPITKGTEPITKRTEPITKGHCLPDDFDVRMAANRRDLRERAKVIWLRLARNPDVTVRKLAAECGYGLASTQGALNALKECGLLVKTGGARNAKWLVSGTCET